MPMSKNDYILLANVLRPHYGNGKTEAKSLLLTSERVRTMDEVVDSLMDACAKQNPLFDRKRFLGAVTPRWHRENRGLPKAERKGTAVRRPAPSGF